MKNNMDKIDIKEVVVVEGRDDKDAVLKAANCFIVETHGFGMSNLMWNQLDGFYKEPGIIIFTDPDYGGERIRKKLKERYPLAKEAFLPRRAGLKKGKIGIENAKPEDIAMALSKVCTVQAKASMTEDRVRELFIKNGLSGGVGALKKRERLGNALGIGYGNSRSLIKKILNYGFTEEVVLETLKNIGR